MGSFRKRNKAEAQEMQGQNTAPTVNLFPLSRIKTSYQPESFHNTNKQCHIPDLADDASFSDLFCTCYQLSTVNFSDHHFLSLNTDATLWNPTEMVTSKQLLILEYTFHTYFIQFMLKTKRFMFKSRCRSSHVSALDYMHVPRATPGACI